MHSTLEYALSTANQEFIATYDGRITAKKETKDGVIYYETNL